jgi:tetratricopeptide (TPR) repeat protein
MPPTPSELPAYDFLEDVDDPLARVLWRALREMRSWAEAPRTARTRPAARPFGEEVGYTASHHPELEEALGTFALLGSTPRLASVGALVAASQQVHDWADARGLGRTALLFAEAAAVLDPDNPILASQAGRTARRAAETHRADTWYDRACILAARKKNRRELIRALIGRGGLLRETGRYSEARQLFGRAARLASSTRRHRQAAEVQHELLTIAAEEGQYTEAEVYMRAALREYPVHHRAVPWLAHDWSFLLVRLGFYREARVLLEAVVPHITRRELQVVVWGTLGRASAGAGMRGGYEEARTRVLSLIGLHEEYAAAALAHLAVGAQFFADWAEAESMAGRAAEIARARQQADVENGALEILDAISTRTPPPPQAELPPRSRIPTIQQRMLRRLEERSKPVRREVLRDPEAGGRPAHPPVVGQPTGPHMDRGQ